MFMSGNLKFNLIYFKNIHILIKIIYEYFYILSTSFFQTYHIQHFLKYIFFSVVEYWKVIKKDIINIK